MNGDKFSNGMTAWIFGVILYNMARRIVLQAQQKERLLIKNNRLFENKKNWKKKRKKKQSMFAKNVM